MNTLTADELLAGSNLSYEVEVPGRLLSAAHQADGGKVRLRPLTVRDLQLITRAAKENDALDVVAEKIIDQQAAAAGVVTAIQVTMPEHGRRRHRNRAVHRGQVRVADAARSPRHVLRRPVPEPARGVLRQRPTRGVPHDGDRDHRVRGGLRSVQ